MTNSQCPNQVTSDRFADFLENRLSQKDTTEIESHLNSCKPCAALLEKAAADNEFWSLVSDLSDDEIDSDWQSYSDSRPSSSKSIETDGSFSQTKPDKQVLAFELIRPLLAATDDPQSAGRIGNHEVLGLVGSGGMGVVIKARDKSLDRIVAIKILAPHLAVFESSRLRFEREAKSAAAVKHEGIIPIYGVDSQAGVPYLVMPYEAGPSLAQRIDQVGQLSVEEALNVLSQVAQSLSAAHRCGLVHRDIKPSNILLAPGTERALLTDFGLAQTTEEQALTLTGMLTGTPLFMSPEQARGEDVDHRSDLFSLGSVMFTMLTGQTVVKPGNGYSIVRFIGSEKMPSVRSIDPTLPVWIDVLVGRLHDREVNSRTQTANEVSQLATQCLAHLRQPKQYPLPEELSFAPASSKKRRDRIVTSVILSLFLILCLIPFGVELQSYFGTDATENTNEALAKPTPNIMSQQAVETESASAQPGTSESKISFFEASLDEEIEDIRQTLNEIEADY